MSIRQLVTQIKRDNLKSFDFKPIKNNVIKNQTNMIEIPDMNPICKLLYEIYKNTKLEDITVN